MKQLRRDPIGPLLAADDAALRSMARRELLGETTPEISLAELPGVRRAVARQQPDGRWKYPGGNPEIRSRAAYDQLETYRQLGVLVCKFGLDHQHPAVAAAAEFLSSCQTEAGDYRGIYGHQYTPNYSAAITELLIRAGYERQRPGREGHAMAAGHAPGRWRLGDPGENARVVPQCHAHRPRNGRTRPQPPVVPPDHRDRAAGPGRASPLPALGGHPPRRRAGQVPVLPPGRLPRPCRAIELAHLLLSLLVDRPAVRARLPRPDRLPAPATPTSPAAWPGSPATRNPAGCGIPGATGPRARTAICGSGSPSAGCSTPSARDGRPCHDRSGDARFPKCRGRWDAV